MAVKVQMEGAIALVTIDREQQLNALNAETLLQLEKEFTALKDDRGIKVVVVTGAGKKAFVAGADIAEMKDMNEREAWEFSGLGQRVFNLLENMPKPVIAAINGYALGGGCELALACDLRFAGDWAKLGQPEIGLGIIPGFGGTRRLARLIGRGRAMEMILGGEHIDAQTALEWGLVQRVYSADELMPKTMEFARRLASYSLRALQAAKAAIAGTEDLGLHREQELFAQLFSGHDQREGMTAFLERRSPKFTE
ncbi:MAG: crotonase [Firmicutes bacterium]|nr:crotonase [Bacillota bacterium]HOB34879.1 enoyl-CoA hydratase-related protein [Bacillota bacterium]HPZ90377.1 enoyl-CoA hydratase-related protein [Bacillota bacterium]HQE02475.1 enoyl-CoA hydratase-related protein [Bacillota bacterium]